MLLLCPLACLISPCCFLALASRVGSWPAKAADACASAAGVTPEKLTASSCSAGRTSSRYQQELPDQQIHFHHTNPVSQQGGCVVQLTHPSTDDHPSQVPGRLGEDHSEFFL
jgi:hypothetical protein